MNVAYLPDAHRREEWPALEALLKPALVEECEVIDPAIDVVWIAYEGQTIFAAATTRLRTDNIAELRLAGGTRFREWIGPLDEVMSDWARNCGADRLVMRGRKGWARYARAFGWVALGTDNGRTIYEKGLR